MTSEPAVPPDGGLVRVRLDVSYDGTDFSGWARQRGRRTVQEVLADALGVVLRMPAPPVLTVAGRTDAGVHARGQVVHLDLAPDAWLRVVGRSSAAPDAALITRLAGFLPPDVRVRRASVAPAGFDARFAALSRRYVYRLATTPWGPDPLRRHDVLWHDRPLDLAVLQAASDRLLGVHDFAAYCRRREGATTIRTLLALSWARESDDVLVATVEADAFCRSMVRALVGALLVVGEGRRAPDWPAAVLAGRVRDSAVNVAPARGLTLEQVRYPDAAGLAERVAQARRRRTLPGS